MSLLKILPSAVDSTSNYTFGNVSANYVTSNGIDLGAYVQAAFDKANTGVSTSTDQYARDTANTAANNIVIIQGVNTTQNTNITSINQYAASGYAAANTNATNITAVNNYAASAYGSANTNATNITSVNQYAASAYASSNTNATNISIMSGVNTTQNTNITTATNLAQGAYDKANTANSYLVMGSKLVATSSNSYFFSGTADVGSPDSSVFAFSTGDFTVECWVYINRAIGFNEPGFFQKGTAGNLNLQRDTSGNLKGWDGADRLTSASMASNTWHHVAFTRSSGTSRIFLNGTQALSWSSSVNYGNDKFVLGYTANGGNRMFGYISNFRAVNGTALYTSSFTPPTTPLTAISGTALLTAKTLSIEDLSTNAFSLTNNGITTSSQSPTFGSQTVNVYVQYVSADGAWEFTNDGTTYLKVADTDKVNTALSIANTATNNISIIQGVDTWQNTQITYVNQFAQSAYDKANTGGSSGIDQYARDTANTAATNISIMQGVNTTQNTNITSVNQYAASGYALANTNTSDISIIQGVNTTQNTNITSVNQYAASAYASANTNATNISIMQGVNTTQNTNITYADSKAQAAFDKANTGSSGVTTFAITLDTFSGNGAQTAFGLSAVPSSKNETMVHINGVYQNKNTYSVSGSTLTLTGVASVSDTIEVETTAGSLMNVAATYYSTRIYTGTGSQTAFTISSGQSANTLFVFNNGICQFPGDDYTVSGTTLTYAVAPATDEVVQIREMPVGRVIPTTVPYMRRYAATGSQTNFTVSSGQTANSMFVYENGVCQVPGNDYTVSGTTLTFLTAPTSDKVIQIREMPV
jgi:hypothetical protein